MSLGHHSFSIPFVCSKVGSHISTINVSHLSFHSSLLEWTIVATGWGLVTAQGPLVFVRIHSIRAQLIVVLLGGLFLLKPVMHRIPVLPGDRGYCNNNGACTETGDCCRCDDELHFWSTDFCSHTHDGPTMLQTW
jgi:hypothetical protein